MTRRIDWRDGATVGDKAEALSITSRMNFHKDRLAKLSADRKRLISRCYQKAARAAKRGK